MIIFLDGEEAACTTIQTQRVCDSFSHDSGALSNTAGKHSQLSNTLGEEDSSSGLGSIGNYLDLPPPTGGFLQFFCGVKIIQLQHRPAQPQG